jgi:serine phosphatase RsbU (regulator of sigma subunit)/pSer/pThr/pTyr-binding forkhead associated (FHA) protein
MPVLEWTSHEGGSYFDLTDEETIVGRHRTCSIVIDGDRVSRHHARFHCESGRVFVEDLKSRNGTQLNGRRIEKAELLEDRDEVLVGRTRFVFHEGDPAALIDRRSEVVGSVLVDSLTGIAPSGNAEAKLHALLDISHRLTRSRSLDEILQGMLDCLFEVFTQAERGVVMLPNETSILSVRRHKRREGSDAGIIVSRSVTNQVMSEGRAILSFDAAEDARFQGSESLNGAGIRSLMCAPLVGTDGESLGVIQIDRRSLGEAFSMEDLELLASVGIIAGQVVENSRLHDEYLKSQLQDQELQIASEVQRLLLPADPPTFEGYEFFHIYEPALELSGDYFDFVQLKDGRLVIAVGDVAGKGVSAALYMARLGSAVRLCLEETDDVATIAARLNHHFIEFGGGHRFLTFMLSILDPKTNTLTMTSAGHCPAVIGSGARIQLLPTDEQVQPPLGIMPDCCYEASTVTLEKGDRIVLYTDGLTEARNAQKDLFGVERIRAAISESTGSAESAARKVVADALEFAGSGGLTDDLTLVSIRRVL